MDTFNTSNGNQVRMRETGVLGVSVAKNSLHDWCIGLDGVVDLREFFQAERDEELGRWRFNAYLVVYPAVNHQPRNNARSVNVFDERTGRLHMRHEGQVAHRETNPAFSEAAFSYFAAHPEPKPWHDAKLGELWEVSISASGFNLNIPCREPLPMQVMVDDSGEFETRFFAHWNGPDVETIDIEDRHIESATLLWSAAK